MSEERDLTQLLTAYNQDTQTVIQKVREEVNEDAVFGRLEEQYDVYDLLLFNEFNLQERLERNAFHAKDWKLKYLQELGRVEQVRDRLEKKTGEKYKALKEGAMSLTKAEIEKYYLPTDDELIELKGLLRKQELRAEYFKAVCDALNAQQWYIKSWLDCSRGGF